MPSRLANLHLDALDPRRVADFWCEVLGWQVLDADEDVGLVEIGPADGRWPGIDIMRVPEPKAGKNRLHIDLRADGSTTADELHGRRRKSADPEATFALVRTGFLDEPGVRWTPWIS